MRCRTSPWLAPAAAVLATVVATLIAGGYPVSGCSVMDSIVANQQIATIIQPRVYETGYALPDDCPFNPDTVMYNHEFLDSIKSSPSAAADAKKAFTCPFCAKAFRSLSYTSDHLERTHGIELADTGRSVCSGELCDVLHCPAGSNALLDRRKCSAGEMEPHKHRCYSVVERCFPADGSAVASKLNAQFTRELCETMTCRQYRSIDGDAAATVGRSKYGYVALLVVGCLALGLFYVALLLYQRQQRVSSDFGRLTKSTDMRYNRRAHEGFIRRRR